MCPSQSHRADQGSSDGGGGTLSPERSASRNPTVLTREGPTFAFADWGVLQKTSCNPTVPAREVPTILLADFEPCEAPPESQSHRTDQGGSDSARQTLINSIRARRNPTVLTREVLGALGFLASPAQPPWSPFCRPYGAWGALESLDPGSPLRSDPGLYAFAPSGLSEGTTEASSH